MSCMSGACDLYDHIMMERQYPLYPGDDHSPLVSDEMECFKIFKQKTGGVMYQHKLLKLTPWNIDAEIKKQNNPKILSKVEHKETIKDERSKKGSREKVSYTYMYYGKEYLSLKALNKKRYYTTVEIRFEELIDIIPYYPYAIAACFSSEGRKHIILANISEVEEDEARALEGGFKSRAYHYRHALQEHYLEVVKRYYSDRYDGSQKYL